MRLSRLSEGMPMTQSNDHRTRRSPTLVDEVDELLALVDVELCGRCCGRGCAPSRWRGRGTSRCRPAVKPRARNTSTSASRGETRAAATRRSGPPECFACSARPVRKASPGASARPEAQSHRGLRPGLFSARAAPAVPPASGVASTRSCGQNRLLRGSRLARRHQLVPRRAAEKHQEHRHKCASEYRKPRGEVVGHREHWERICPQKRRSRSHAAGEARRHVCRQLAIAHHGEQHRAPQQGEDDVRTRRGPPPRRPAGTCTRETRPIPQTPPP